MKDKIQVLLDEVIETKINKLNTIVDADERAAAIEELTELHKMRIEESKIEVETACQQNQTKSQNLDRWINLGVQVGLTIGGWAMYSVWQHREQKFELVGTPSNPMFRNLLSRMIPNLKK